MFYHQIARQVYSTKTANISFEMCQIKMFGNDTNNYINEEIKSLLIPGNVFCHSVHCLRVCFHKLKTLYCIKL
jgi:hypothetical protein